MAKIYLYLLLVLLLYTLTFAQWSGDPATNTPICTQSYNQSKAAITSDGNGGAIMVWDDNRTNTFSDIYAQKVNAAGVVQWAVDGVSICNATGYQSEPFIVSDGAGGAIIVWEDSRNGFPNTDIYAQRIDASGNVLWSPNGVVVYDFSDYAMVTDVISDGSGGAIVVWDDLRSGFYLDIYAQRIDGNGNLLWTPSSGVPISTAENDQSFARMVSDGNNGAIIAFSNDIGSSGNPSLTIYAQRINGSGVVQWATNGVEVCSPGPNQGIASSPRICSDGNGGAIIAWDDNRSGTSSDVYAQRINSAGVVQWATDGIAISNASGVSELGVVLTSDNAGGAILSWLDDRNGSGFNIYAQRVNASGVIQWPTSGVSVYGVNNTSPTGLRMISDGANGAIIIWFDDTLPSDWNIFAQKINSSGVIQWVASGLAVSNAADIQTDPAITTDGQGGAIVVWEDWRNFNTTGLDIYAQRVFQDGVLPVELSTFSAFVVGSSVNLKWMTMTEVNNYGFEVERLSYNNSGWIKIGFTPGSGNSNSIKMYSFIDSEVPPGKYAYRLKQIDNDGAYEYSNIIEVDLGSPDAFSLSQNYPNPFNPGTKISWQLPLATHQTIKVYDILGNEVATLVDEYREAGNYEIDFNASGLASGMYLYKLQAGSFVETKKMILLR